jgi:tRNA pseudouridine13 synthase
MQSIEHAVGHSKLRSPRLASSACNHDNRAQEERQGEDHMPGSPFDPLLPPPFLTGDLPGIGGVIKREPEDFEVEEIPAYPPSGSGDFLYLWIEKRSMGAEYFTRLVARLLELSPGEVGVAGLKDRHAVTRQMVSVPSRAEHRVASLDTEGLRVLQVSRHGNKLRPGHLRGNRFRILIRDVALEAAERIEPILNRIRQQGLPNFFGPQRFGHQGETAQIGLAMLRGTGARPPRSPFLRKLALSAAQAALFNHYLCRRAEDGLMRTVVPGDVMAKWPAGGMFVAGDILREQARFDEREIVHSGPIFGRKTFAAASDAAAREKTALEGAEIATAAFASFGKLLQGTRRHNLIYVDDIEAANELSGVRLTFSLPAGSYATVLLRELMKGQTPGEAGPDEC